MKLFLFAFSLLSFLSCNDPSLKKEKGYNQNENITKKSSSKKISPTISKDTLFYNFTSDMSRNEYIECLIHSSDKNKNFTLIWETDPNDKVSFEHGYEILNGEKPIQFLIKADNEFSGYPYDKLTTNNLDFICLEYYDSISNNNEEERKTYRRILKIYEQKYGKYEKNIEIIKNGWPRIKKGGGIELLDLRRETYTWKNRPKILIEVEISDVDQDFKIFYLSKIYQKKLNDFLTQKKSEQEHINNEEILRQRKEQGVKDL